MADDNSKRTSSMMYIYVETPLHAGSGRAVGVVDLPIQRERVTGYPLVQSSGVKGRLRAEAASRGSVDIEAVFGPDTNNANAYAGALSVGDARLLLFPVRSLYGVFAWTTSASLLARYLRDLAACGLDISMLPELSGLRPKVGDALVADGSALAERGRMVLEEFSYNATTNADVAELGKYLAGKALPQSADYAYWRDNLTSHLVVLSENDFRDFVQYATEVVTRVKLNDDTKTVARGMLWTEESLPSDTLLYSPLYMGKERKDAALRKKENGDNARDAKTAATLMQELTKAFNDQRIRLGGDETVGRGSVALRFAGGRLRWMRTATARA